MAKTAAELVASAIEVTEPKAKAKVGAITEALSCWLTDYPLPANETLSLKIVPGLLTAGLVAYRKSERVIHYVLVGEPLVNTLNGRELKCVVAHEFGHLICQDEASDHLTEYTADATAVGLTNDPGAMIGGLRKVYGMISLSPKLAVSGTGSHPPLAARIKNIIRTAHQLGF